MTGLDYVRSGVAVRVMQYLLQVKEENVLIQQATGLFLFFNIDIVSFQI